MLRKAFIPVMILFLCLGTLSTVTLAGDPPSRLGFQVHKLEAVLLVLESVKLQLEVRFIDSNAIDGNRPLPAVEGLVARFETMATQLQVLESRVVLVMDTLDGGSLIAVLPDDVKDALEDIRDDALAVSELASEIINDLPYDERVEAALKGVQENAYSIFDTVSRYLPSLFPIDQ